MCRTLAPRRRYNQVKKKMFIWQVKHVFIRLKETLREAVRQPTFADGMQARARGLFIEHKKAFASLSTSHAKQ